ncbi:MAG TPA: hypothetical protein VEX86_02450 [Longimicrobium sp.]|nr:hypothetical protein [Longimicrobium sp.]
MTLKVGLIVGREWSFPPAFIEEVNRRDQGVTAEYVKLGAPRMDEPCEYAVIIDRISHEVPFYRTYLKQAALQGCAVVNNPFMWTADDKYFGAALATRLGIAHPKTMVLPNKEYQPGIVHDESLRNLQYPLDWQGIVDYIGMPCILKDAHGGGWKDVYVCQSLEELIHHYDTSGLLTMIVQEFIEWDQFIRCICIGQDKVMPIKYDPKERKYHVEHDHLGPELGARVVADSLKLVRALGYDMNSMEWAVRDGIPYAIDFMNPAPDMDIYSLTPHYFEWAISAMADMAIDLARNPRRQVKELRWDALFTGSREGGEGPSGGHLGSGSGAAATSSDDAGPVGSGTGGRGATGGGAQARETGGGPALAEAARTLDSATQAGGPTAAMNQKIQELTFDAPARSGEAQGGGGEGGHTGGAAGTEAIRAEGSGGFVDQSPITDLEPPADTRTQPGSTSAAGYEAGAGRADGGHEGGNGRDGSSFEGGENEKGNGRAAEDRS